MNLQELKIKHDYIEVPRRFYRGGSWSSGASGVSAAWRFFIDPGLRRDFIGFRFNLKTLS